MNLEQHTPRGDDPRFHTTRWSAVLLSAQSQAPGVSLGSVGKLIFRLRKRYASILREEVARTVSDPAEVDQEIQALCEALIATEGRLDT